jgi:hypothetical protein
MTQLIELQKIQKIEFQIDQKNVLITYFIFDIDQLTKFHFLVSNSALNKLLGEIQCINNDKNIYELMEIIQITENEFLYTLNFEANELSLEQINMDFENEFMNEIIQIRA